MGRLAERLSARRDLLAAFACFFRLLIGFLSGFLCLLVGLFGLAILELGQLVFVTGVFLGDKTLDPLDGLGVAFALSDAEHLLQMSLPLLMLLGFMLYLLGYCFISPFAFTLVFIFAFPFAFGVTFIFTFPFGICFIFAFTFALTLGLVGLRLLLVGFAFFLFELIFTLFLLLSGLFLDLF